MWIGCMAAILNIISLMAAMEVRFWEDGRNPFEKLDVWSVGFVVLENEMVDGIVGIVGRFRKDWEFGEGMFCGFCWSV